MPRIEQNKRRPVKARTIALISALALAVIAGGVYLTHQALQRAALTQDNQQYADAMRSASGLSLKRKDVEAAKVMISYSATALQPSNKTSALLDAANFYLSAEDYADALKLFKTAQASGADSVTVASGAGQAAEGLGDYTAAAEYYRTVIKSLKAANEPSIGGTIKTFEDRLARVEARQ